MDGDRAPLVGAGPAAVRRGGVCSCCGYHFDNALWIWVDGLLLQVACVGFLLGFYQLSVLGGWLWLAVFFAVLIPFCLCGFLCFRCFTAMFDGDGCRLCREGNKQTTLRFYLGLSALVALWFTMAGGYKLAEYGRVARGGHYANVDPAVIPQDREPGLVEFQAGSHISDTLQSTIRIRERDSNSQSYSYTYYCVAAVVSANAEEDGTTATEAHYWAYGEGSCCLGGAHTGYVPVITFNSHTFVFGSGKFGCVRHASQNNETTHEYALGGRGLDKYPFGYWNLMIKQIKSRLGTEAGPGWFADVSSDPVVIIASRDATGDWRRLQVHGWLLLGIPMLVLNWLGAMFLSARTMGYI